MVDIQEEDLTIKLLIDKLKDDLNRIANDSFHDGYKAGYEDAKEIYEPTTEEPNGN